MNCNCDCIHHGGAIKATSKLNFSAAIYTRAAMRTDAKKRAIVWRNEYEDDVASTVRYVATVTSAEILELYA